MRKYPEEDSARDTTVSGVARGREGVDEAAVKSVGF